MKNSENKLKEIEIGEISLLKENKRKYSSPKRKNNISKKFKYYRTKKVS